MGFVYFVCVCVNKYNLPWLPIIVIELYLFGIGDWQHLPRMSLAWLVAEDDGASVGIVVVFVVTIFGQGIWRRWGCGGGIGAGDGGRGIDLVDCGK